MHALGMPVERAELFGKPHIGEVIYVGDKPRNIDYPICQICGRRATNNHHLAPKGMGGGSKYLEIGGQKLQSSLITVCGSGNASGCHGKFHQCLITARWKWYRDTSQEKWFEGDYLNNGFDAYSDDLYVLGYWELDIMGEKREIHG